MYIQRNKIKNKKTGKIYSSVFLCTKYREGKKVKTRVEANLSSLPEQIVLGIENMLRSDRETTVCLKDISIPACIDYGYVFVLYQIMKQLRIDEVLEKTLSADAAALVKAMLIGKIVTGGSKLCIFNWMNSERGIGKLPFMDVQVRKVDQLYHALGEFWLHQSKIEKKWFRYHRGAHRRIYLYDLTSTYFEGKDNALATYGYSRDGKRGKKQMCVGLLAGEDGFPLRIEAFSGNTQDSATVSEQIRSLKKEFGVEDIVFVGDRGMHITYHLENDPELMDEDIHFITGLTHAQIQTLVARGTIQMSLFSSDLAEVSAGGKRYILSVNPDLKYKEEAFLDSRKDRCEALVENIRKAWEKRHARNEENRGKQEEHPGGKYKHLKTEFTQKDMEGYRRRVEHIVHHCGMGSYYSAGVIDDQSFTMEFNRQEFDKSRALCGKYVLCTNVPAQEMPMEQVRGEYKKLQNVEHAFRDLKSDNISIRPVYHHNENQTRGHVLLCFFAYAMIKTMEDKLFPFLKTCNRTHKTKLSFNDLTAELNNIKMCKLGIGKEVTSVRIPDLTALQKKIFQVLNINPEKMTA